MRWFGVPFVFLQFGLYAPPPGVELPFPRWPVAIGVAATLVAANLWARSVATRTDDLAQLTRMGWTTTVLDTSLILLTVVLFGFDESTRIWPVLSFAMVEGVMRGGLRGGLAIWGYSSVVFILDQLARLPGRDDPAAWIGSIPFAVGILAFIAIGSGTLEDRARLAHRRAEAEADRLRQLATLARQMTAERRADRVFDNVAHAAADVTGLAAAGFYEHQGGDRWVLRAAVGIQHADQQVDRPDQLPGLSRLLVELSGPAMAPMEGDLARLTAELAPHIRTLYAVPIVRGFERLGLLLLGDEEANDAIAPQLRDVLDVFAADAAVAIRNARLAEAEIRTIDELRELDRLKDDFVQILTHELRSPMTAMAGYAELLEQRWDQVDPEKRQQYLNAIKRGTYRLSALIQDMLDANQAADTELPIDPDDVELEPVVREVAEQELHGHPAHELQLRVDPATPLVRADPTRVVQVMHNLVSNAIKYSPDGGPIEIDIGPTSRGRVRIAVTDHGLGMRPRDQERLFTKFSRFHKDLRIKGTGLGLYLAAALVDAMGGRILVDSEVGRGSTFTVELPAVGRPVTPPTGAVEGPA